MNNKEKTLELDRWAVVGATDNQTKYGYKIVKMLKENGYSVFPINPNKKEVAGLDCYFSISEVEAEIDVVDLVVNPKIGIKVMSEVAEANIEYVWLQPGARSEEIKEFAAENNIKLVEDCIYATLS